MNPLAVEIAAREGARTVWLPTVDAVNEAGERDAPPGAKVPVWVKLQLELREQGLEIEPVPVARRRRIRPSGDAGGPGDDRPPRDGPRDRSSGPRARSSPSSTRRSTPESRTSSSPTRSSPPRTSQSRISAALAARGALLERCFTTPHTGKIEWERWIENIRATGPEHSVLSTDLGQVFNPPVEDGIALMVDRLLAAGFDEDEVHVMAVVNTRRVAGAEPL